MNVSKVRRSGFTLIELLIVIGILAILLAITLVALNPARQFAQANNTKRRSDVNAILNAVHQYSIDNQGNLSSLGLPTTAAVVSDGVGLVDICDDLIPDYIAALPVDPQTNGGTPVDDCGDPYNTNYTVVTSLTDGRITVAAPGAELNEIISVTR